MSSGRQPGSDEDALVRGLDELWRRGDRPRARPDAYDFSHGKLRDAVYEQLSPAQRRRNHLRVAEALERLADPDAVSAQIAAHYEQAGAPERAHRLVRARRGGRGAHARERGCRALLLTRASSSSTIRRASSSCSRAAGAAHRGRRLPVAAHAGDARARARRSSASWDARPGAAAAIDRSGAAGAGRSRGHGGGGRGTRGTARRATATGCWPSRPSTCSASPRSGRASWRAPADTWRRPSRAWPRAERSTCAIRHGSRRSSAGRAWRCCSGFRATRCRRCGRVTRRWPARGAARPPVHDGDGHCFAALAGARARRPRAPAHRPGDDRCRGGPQAATSARCSAPTSRSADGTASGPRARRAGDGGRDGGAGARVRGPHRAARPGGVRGGRRRARRARGRRCRA